MHYVSMKLAVATRSKLYLCAIGKPYRNFVKV
jgi:hypothetical protein